MCYTDDFLYISFEGKHRIVKYTLDGQFIENVRLAKPLRKSLNYKSANQGLESIAYSEKYGIVTAPEHPFKKKKYHTIYAKKHQWKFHSDGSITALEFISKNKLLILTRKFNHFSRRRTIKLLQLNLKQCHKDFCKVKELATLDTYDGCSPDNFEGLTKVRKNTFLMISDDNHSIFQKTLLVLFEIK